MTDEINNIKKRIFKHKNSEELHITRIPKGTFEMFKTIANEEYCGDYGMLLKFMIDELYIKPPIYYNLQEQLYRLIEEFEHFKQEKSPTENKEDNNDDSVTVKNVNGQRMIQRKKRID